MKKINRELECILRCVELSSLEEPLAKLVDLELLPLDKAKAISLSSDPHKQIHKILTDARIAGAIQLLEYEWQILPKESIKITIVTDKANASISSSEL
jgi:hypothetical protein